MLTIYCNNCFRQKELELTLELYLSQCGHVLCKQCVNAKCAICQKDYKGMIINKTMTSSVAAYFDNPLKSYKHFQKVAKFQIEQEAHLHNYYVNTFPAELKTLQREYDGIVKLDQRLSTDLEKEKKRIDKLKEYLAYHERRLEQPNQLEPPIPGPVHSRGRPRQLDSNGGAISCWGSVISGNQRFRPPQTPTLSLHNSSADGAAASTSSAERNNLLSSKNNPNDFQM